MNPALKRLALAALSLGAAALTVAAATQAPAPTPQSTSARHLAAGEAYEIATFAGGCYWCTEADFDKVEGVVETISGFMGGHTKNPTYRQVAYGETGHAEVVQVKFDPARVSYKKLVDYYWRTVDVLDGGGQFCDRGSSYRPAIFTHSPEQKRIAEASKAALEASKRFNRPIAVKIEAASEFTPGPDDHQNYYKKNSVRYGFYRKGCGRDARLKRLWGAKATH